MTEHDHEPYEELLAGYVLHTLSGQDIEAAERLVTDHLPDCERCRATLSAFQEISGELALGTPARQPPDLVWPRIRREVRARRFLPVRRLSGPWATAAVAVALVGMIGWNAFLSQRVSDTESRQAQFSDIFSFMNQPQSTLAPLSQMQQENQSAPMSTLYRPGVRHMYLFGSGVPDPAPGHVYRLWLGKDGDFVEIEEFSPDDNGVVIIDMYIDLSRYDQMLVTEEEEGPPHAGPSGIRRWFASF
jgi:hypothetical protein